MGQGRSSKRGFDNYDQITIEYFLNANAMTEAFKKGICAINMEADPVKRERIKDFPASKEAIAETSRQAPPVVTGFPFNTRLPKFPNPGRAAGARHAHDFEWGQQESVRSGKYARTMSYRQGIRINASAIPRMTRKRRC